MNGFWYAVASSAALGETPLGVRALGNDLVLFRDESGAAACLTDRCAHRGDRLSAGRVDGNLLRCRYHHWAYRADGQCDDIPTAGPGSRVPERARVRSWAVREEGGWLHVFLGESPQDAVCEPPRFPELEDAAWRVNDFELSIDAHYTRVVENAVDMSHLPFLHQATYGTEQPIRPPLLDHAEQEWGAQGSYDHATRAPKPLGWFLRKPIASRTTFTWHLPCYTSTRAVTDMGTILLVMCHLPVDGESTRILYRLARDFARSPLLDGFFEASALAVFEEDRDSVVRQRPFRIPVEGDGEVHTAADLFPLGFRKARRAAWARGLGAEEAS